MEQELLRVEATLISLGIGPGKAWARDHIIAIAWLSHLHQLGCAVIHLDSYKNSDAMDQAKTALMGSLVDYGVCHGRDSDYWADRGLKHYLFGLCLACGGTGLTHEQQICPECDGSKRVSTGEIEQRCVKIIEGSLEVVERGLIRLLKDWKDEPLQTKHSRMEFNEHGARWTPPAFDHY